MSFIVLNFKEREKPMFLMANAKHAKYSTMSDEWNICFSWLGFARTVPMIRVISGFNFMAPWAQKITKPDVTDPSKCLTLV